MERARRARALAWGCMAAACCATAGDAATVDIGPDNGRRDSQAPHAANWLIADGTPMRFQSGDLQAELRTAANGPPLRAFFEKAALVRGAPVAADGVVARGDDAAIELVLRGLAPGRHTLATFHNVNDDEPAAPIEATVASGGAAPQTVTPSRRGTDDADLARAYIEFDAAAESATVITLRPQAAGAASRVVLNGFELDESDPRLRARQPQPAWGDEHVPPKPVLRWSAAPPVRHADVYFGVDAGAVAAATPTSPEYQGRVDGAEWASPAVDPAATYYWRVDQTPADRSEPVRGRVWSFRVRQLAFPGAEGYGRFARGGRGGRVYRVTSLADAGPGSLREAVEATGPRTVVFDVAGRIVLQDKLVIRHPYLTVAGHTAPGKGVCISNFNLGMLGAHDVILRYLRVRVGDTAGVTLDGMGMASSDHSIIDHCSISWTQDESFSSRGARNITLQRTLISEALNIAGHKKYEKGKQHGFAASIGGDIGSFHHNLLAHCAGRNWSLAGGLDQATRHTGRLDIRNNVVYNWSHRTTDGGAMEVNFVNNYYKPGPATRVFHVLKPELEAVHAFGPQRYFVEGNVMEGRYGAGERLAGVVLSREFPPESYLVEQPFFDSHVQTTSAAEAYDDVLADVGCNVPALDDHDARVLREVRDGAAEFHGSVSGLPGLPDSQDDVGGWEDYPEEHRAADWDSDGDGLPNAWESARGLKPDSPAGDFGDANGDGDGDGWTNLEEYLHEAAAE